jgi:transcriptional regulator of heat shock response
MKQLKQMKFKYIYQQFISHISIILVAFLVLSFLFAHYVENLVYENKAEELISYGKSILKNIEHNPVHTEQIINQYSSVLAGRKISFSIFDQDANLYSVGQQGPAIKLSDAEWTKITKGQTIIVNQDYKRFDQEGVSFVVLPYINHGRFVGGIILTSPISGTSEMISQMNKYLLYTTLIGLAVSFF